MPRLTPMDEQFVHQIPEPLPNVVTFHEHWRESLFFILHPPSGPGDVVILTLAHFPARQLVDSLQLGRVGGTPTVAHHQRSYDGDPHAMVVGPVTIDIAERTRSQTHALDLHYLFAPLKHARLDYMVQKAVEMGASILQPVLTRHTQVSRVNGERMRANVVEAAEQCGILSLAEVAEPVPLERFLAQRDQQRLLVFCDEAAEATGPLQALQAGAAGSPGTDVLIGPEGGFAEEERDILLRQPQILRLSLGPRILRADTAAVAALALVQATLGDWARITGTINSK